MSDPLRTDPSRALDAAPEPGRDAKIEQLLLVGLDHYFTAQYEQVGSSRVDLQACKLEYSIVSPK